MISCGLLILSERACRSSTRDPELPVVGVRFGFSEHWPFPARARPYQTGTTCSMDKLSAEWP
jgi:hypothetical protein